jgi:hypothetical protein
MSTHWSNDGTDDFPYHNPQTQEFTQAQDSFDRNYPTPGEWLEPSPQLSTRPHPTAQRQRLQFTNQQMIIMGAAVTIVIVVLCGSLVAIGALNNHTTLTVSNPISAAAAATATAAATMAAGDNSGLPTTLPTSQPATTAPNSTATPKSTTTPVGTSTFSDPLNSWSSKVITHVGLRFDITNPRDFGDDPSRVVPTSSAHSASVEWNVNNTRAFQATGFVFTGNSPGSFAFFMKGKLGDTPTMLSPSSVTAFPACNNNCGWTGYRYIVTITNATLPNYVGVAWISSVLPANNPNEVHPPELGDMTITYQQ